MHQPDVLLLVECHRVDAAKVTSAVTGYTAFQDLTSDGTRNVAIIWRNALAATGCDLFPLVDARGLRPRYGARLDLPGPLPTFAVAHRPPERNDDTWPTFDRRLARQLPANVVLGMDSNARTRPQRTAMQRRLGLPWVAVGLMGVATRHHVELTALPRTTGDHPPVLAVITLKENR